MVISEEMGGLNLKGNNQASCQTISGLSSICSILGQLQLKLDGLFQDKNKRSRGQDA